MLPLTNIWKCFLTAVLVSTAIVKGAERWETPLVNYLKEFDKGPRSLYSADSKKTLGECKDYLRTQIFVTFKLHGYLQDFNSSDTKDGKQVQGTNVIGVLKGANYGTSKDKMFVLGAHYDTRQKSAGGVVNDGSGVVALLRAAEIFSKQKSVQHCKRNHSILFVAFDQGETESDSGAVTFCNKPCGSQAFVKKMADYTGGGSIQSAIVLDCILNFDTKPDTQVISTSSENYFAASSEIVAGYSAGDYIAAFGREDEGEMMKRVGQLFRQNQPGEMSLQEFPLRFSGKPTTGNLTQMKNFFQQSDQLSFWENAPSVKSLLLTDTCYDRGFMRDCKNDASCDSLSKIQSNLKYFSFMQAVISTVLSYVNEVTEGCPDVNHCAAGQHLCSANAECTDLFGSYHCSCKKGYSGDGYTCTDINECLKSPCKQFPDRPKCKNTPGSFECVEDTGSSSGHSVCLSLLLSMLTLVIAVLIS